MLVGRSQLKALMESDAFFWATGIEDTFIVEPWKGSGRKLDEYELTKHYEHLDSDLDLMADLGVSAARYGIPWYRANPRKGAYDWSFADRAFEKMLGSSIEPIVDLVHYGTPEWMENGFMHPDYPKFIAEYAHEMASRYKGQIRWYTPLNEPRITAWYCGRIGWWPPYYRGWKGFCKVMVAVSKGIVETCAALREVDPEIVLTHVDATDIYFTEDPSLQGAVELRKQIVFLALDLITGRVGVGHGLENWLEANGVGRHDVEWFHERRAEIDVLGVNMYPMFSWKKLIKSSRGLRNRLVYCSPDVLEDICEMYSKRYGAPIFVSETAAIGSLKRRSQWMDGSVNAIANLRARGVPVIGYTWWPMFSLVSWGYRQHQGDLGRYLLKMGLWDLSASEDLARVETDLVGRYKSLAASKANRVGRLGGPRER